MRGRRTTQDRGRTRDGVNVALVRLVAVHAAAVIAEWAAVIGTLVLVFDREGTAVTGLASIALLAGSLAVAPVAGALIDRLRPQRTRTLGLAVQALGYGVAAAAAAFDLPTVVAVLAAMLALGAVTTLRPSGAVLIPAHAHSSDELVRANLWVWYAEGGSVLGGPLLAAALLGAGGPAAVLWGCAGAAALGVSLSLVDLAHDPPVRAGGADGADGAALRSAMRAFRGQPGLASVLAAIWAQYVMIGALDYVLVVLARDRLDLGPAGPGVLSAAFGLGAVAAIFAPGLVRGTRMAPVLAGALTVVAVALVTLGLAVSYALALVVLPVLGACRSLLDGASRMLLQRSAGPDTLRSVFTLREVFASCGLIAGSLLALVVLELADVDAAFVAVGLVPALVVALGARGLRRADAGADIPVVEMSTLRRVPMFAPLPPPLLEGVARAASTVAVDAGDVVIRQGDHGDCFYVVVDGEFEVSMSGRSMRRAGRLDHFGEVALLADIPRTATITATTPGTLLAIERHDFLDAVTGHGAARDVAWHGVRTMELEPDTVRLLGDGDAVEAP